MKDQSESLSSLLDRGVPVLVYHGNFDLVLPVSGMSEALNNLQWNGFKQWSEVENRPYFHTNKHGDKARIDIFQYSDFKNSFSFHNSHSFLE